MFFILTEKEQLFNIFIKLWLVSGKHNYSLLQKVDRSSIKKLSFEILKIKDSNIEISIFCRNDIFKNKNLALFNLTVKLA